MTAYRSMMAMSNPRTVLSDGLTQLPLPKLGRANGHGTRSRSRASSMHHFPRKINQRVHRICSGNSIRRGLPIQKSLGLRADLAKTKISGDPSFH
jgi:hypothetical protein